MSDLDDILYQLGVYPTQRGYHITAVAVAIGRQEPNVIKLSAATGRQQLQTPF